MSVGRRPVFVVVNARAGGGRAGRQWPALSRRLAARFGDFAMAQTEAPRHATALVREAIASGAELIIAVGGDGTANEALNGMLQADGSLADVRFAAIACGTGSDFARTVTPCPVEALANEAFRMVDVGRATFRDADGREASRLFLNVASFGLSGAIDHIVGQQKSALLPGKLVFLIAALRAISSYRFHRVRLVFDGRETLETDIALVAVANGRYFGGGMKIAPDARPDDGMFDVVVLKKTTKATLIRDLPLIYRGAHRDHPAISIRRVHRLDAQILPLTGDEAALLDLDGETPGFLPATFEIMPRALKLAVA